VLSSRQYLGGDHDDGEAGDVADRAPVRSAPDRDIGIAAMVAFKLACGSIGFHVHVQAGAWCGWRNACRAIESSPALP
jgi:hypothetical protein